MSVPRSCRTATWRPAGRRRERVGAIAGSAPSRQPPRSMEPATSPRPRRRRRSDTRPLGCSVIVDVRDQHCIGRRRGRRHGSDGACGTRRRTLGRGRGGVDCPAGLLVDAAAARRTRDDGSHHPSGGRLPGARRRRHLRRCRCGRRLGVDGHLGGLDPGGSGDDGPDVAHRPRPGRNVVYAIDSLWVTVSSGVVRVDPASLEEIPRSGSEPEGIAADEDNLDQSARLQGGAPHRPADEQGRGHERRGQRPDSPLSAPMDPSVVDGDIWVAMGNGAEVVRIDASGR